MIKILTNYERNVAIDILMDGRSSIKELGIDQLQGEYPNEHTIDEMIENKNAFINSNHTAILNIKYIDKSYSHFNLKNYAVIHTLAVKKSSLKKGVATNFLQEVMKYLFEKGIKTICIDTHEGNIPMINLIKKLGFSYLGEVIVSDGTKRVAYKKQA